METQQILTNTSLTKTEKIRQLLALGLTRKEVSNLTGCNYGFVQNVFAKYWPGQVRSRRIPASDIFSFIPFNRRFGVEIEAHNITHSVLLAALQGAGINVQAEGYNHSTRNYWKIVSDSSISGQNSFELVSPILQGQAGLDELQIVCRVLKAKNAYINRTCGLHIHFDAVNLQLAQIKNLIVNYSRFETIIDSFMPNSRRGNSNFYCKSVRLLAERVDRASSISQLVSIQNTRYQKINLQSYIRHQTIEFRQHSGTIEFEKISTWVLFLHNLVEYSNNKRVEASEATFESLRTFQQPEIFTYINNRIADLAA